MFVSVFFLFFFLLLILKYPILFNFTVLVCGELLTSVPVELAPQSEAEAHNSYVRMVDKPNEAAPSYDDIFENLLERREVQMDINK